MPTNRNISVWRGNTETIPVQVKTKVAGVSTAVNLTGSTLNFLAQWAGGSLAKVLDITDEVLGLAELPLTAAETKSFPASVAINYEIERRVGSSQRTILYGKVVANGGINSDT